MQTINNKAGKKLLKNLTTITDSSKLQMFYQELKMYQQILWLSEMPLDMDFVENTQPLKQLPPNTIPKYFTFQTEIAKTAKRCDYIKMFNEDFYNISILPCGNGVEIYRFETYQTGKGIGSYLMKIFNEISTRLEMPVYLVPGEVGTGETYRHDGDAKRRRDFYHRHGFKRINTKSLYWKNSEAARIDRIDICLNTLNIIKQQDAVETVDSTTFNDGFLHNIADMADDLMKEICGEKYDSLICDDDNTISYTENRQGIYNFIYDEVYNYYAG